MAILVLSPTEIIAEALVLLLERYGFSAHRDKTQQAELLLRDLIGARPPYPGPLDLPSYALIETDEQKTRALLELGYRRCFDITKGSDNLIRQLKSIYKGNNSHLSSVWVV